MRVSKNWKLSNRWLIRMDSRQSELHDMTRHDTIRHNSRITLKNPTNVCAENDVENGIECNGHTEWELDEQQQ